MNRVLVQQTHDARFNRILSELDEAFETVVLADSELGDLIEANQQHIDGFVVFHLTNASVKATELVTNERFNRPTTPIAYFGKLGTGTRLPYAVSHFGDASLSDAIRYLSAPRSLSVLVVEDDDGIRDVLDLSLSRHFQVDVAADGEQAIQRLENAHYDIVVLDVMLPKISGDEVFVHARATRPDMPILIITAYDTEKRALEYAFRGADGYVAKPFDSNLAFRQTLIDTLRSHHDRRSVQAIPHERAVVDDARRQYEARMRAYT